MKNRGKFVWENGVKLVRYVSDRHISVHAASACFFLVLAFFPMLVLLLGLIRYTGYSVQTLTELIDGLVPAALYPAAEKLVISTYRNTTGTVLSISVLTALWSASRGVYGLLCGMNAIYDVRESRPWWQARTVSVLYTFVFLLVLLLTLVLHVFGKGVIRFLVGLHLPGFNLLAWLIDQRFLLLLVVLSLAFAAMYMFLPDRRNRFKESLPGAVLAAVGWQMVSLLFSVYVEKVSAYANIYGSVYAVALSLLWLYLCVCILFFGGALNRWLRQD